MDLKYLFFCTFAISSALSSCCMESVVTKITYKKSTNSKEKPHGRIKNNISLYTQTTAGSDLAIMPNEDDFKTTTSYRKDTSISSGVTDYFETTSKEDTTTIANDKIATNSARDLMSCICGIFLSSQFVKGSTEPPKGDPVISSVMEHSFACNSFGQKQCQTKCLEQIVRHLPNSANILCASLDRDIYKERAFLFVRNCSSKWHNTNLAAGRGYCCKNGIPYSCPKK